MKTRLHHNSHCNDGKMARLTKSISASARPLELDNARSFDEFLERKFPESRRQAYYLMAIHEQLPRIHKVELQQVGWAKATELAKVARRDGERFESATWLHKARELPKEEFKRRSQSI
jgi:hypothetical protein